MKQINAEFVRETRQALGMTQIEFAEKIGASQGRLSKWEKGLDSPSTKYALQILALAQNNALMKERLVPLGAGGAEPTPFLVVGEVQAGAWNESIEWDHDGQKQVYVTPPPGLERIDVRGFEVRGTSMNSVYPDGTLVFVQATISNGVIPKSGQHVLVSRRNKTGLYEATLKEFSIDEDGKNWLWPRSTDPNHQTPIPYDDGNSEDVTITGIVRFSVLRAP